jgi:methionine synthase II (cobalamin-independent)
LKRSTERILTTHTGSRPLPELVRRGLAAKRRGEAYDQAALDAALTNGIGAVVRSQMEVGIDIVNDGELSKTSWNDYVVHRVDGLKKNFTLGPAAPRAGASLKELFVRAKPDSRGVISKARRATSAPTSPSFMTWPAA